MHHKSFIANCVQITIWNTCPAAKFTKFKAKKLIIKDKLKFLYVKQQELNSDLYYMHFQLDNERKRKQETKDKELTRWIQMDT